MEYKVFEANGTKNKNVDVAAFNNFCVGGKSGIIIKQRIIINN